MKDSSLAYLLWLLCLVGFCGIHRFYLDRPISGIIWLLTGGLCLVGQIVDLFLIPKITDEENLKQRMIHGQKLPY